MVQRESCQTKNRYDATLEIINDVTLRIITDHAFAVFMIEENSSINKRENG
jgi:hypothetical protein